MKKIFVFILAVAWLAALYAQPPATGRDAVHLSSFFGYPLNLGDASASGWQVTENRLLPLSVELEPAARHQIGAIPDQTVWHQGDNSVGFYVLTDTLQDRNVALSCQIDFPPEGKITFDAQNGRFRYFPAKTDTRAFTVTFTAKSESKVMTQDVLFTLMPATPPEYAAFGVEPVKPMPPSTDDYTIISQSVRRNVRLNNVLRDTVRSFSITGKELVFDSRILNKLRYLSGRSDLEELNLYAEKVIIRDALQFPQTRITMYAKELVFEDLPGRQRASVCTSPVMFDVLAENTGQNGADAGSITLYIQDFKQSSPAKRLISVGGKGQNVAWNTEQAQRIPGNGGNGGLVTSTVEVSGFCDQVRGSAGVQVDSRGTIVAAGKPGTDGSFVHCGKTFAWLHPNLVSAVVKHAKDAYLNVYNGFTYQTFSEYTRRIADLGASGEWDGLDDEIRMELTNAVNEMQTLMHRINQNLDFFGNPVGWVPMLSFEVNKLAFEQELEKAIRVMYLSYWLKNIDSSNAQHIQACNEAIDMVRQDLADNKKLMNQLVRLIPELQDEATTLEQLIDELLLRIEQKTAELLSKAKGNVKKRNRYNKISGVLSAVAKVAPVVCSIVPGAGTAVGSAIGSAVTAGNNLFSKVTNASDTYGYAGSIGDFFDVAGGFLESGGGFSEIADALNGIDLSTLGSGYNTVKDAYQTMDKTVSPLVKSIEKLHQAFARSSTPNDQVQAELNRLKAESREYQALVAEAEVLNTRKTQLMSKLAVTFDQITSTTVEIQKNMAAVDGLGRDVFNNNSKRDLRAMQYLDDMDRRARERLLKYHYYIAKSYEYRLLKPYTAELNLSAIMDRFVTIAESNPGKPVLDAQDFQNLKAVFEEQLSSVTLDILDEYNTNRPSVTGFTSFSLTESDLAELNAGRGIRLNIYERGMISPNRENVRIVGFGVPQIKVHLEGDQNPSFANFELLMMHSGTSMIRKNGEIFYFNHLNNQNQNPITWGVTYDAKFNTVEKQEPSFESQSLLYSLLPDLYKGEIMIYSRPGAWADLYISKYDNVSPHTKLVIDELAFMLNLDYSQRPKDNRNLDVTAGDIDDPGASLTPLITTSRADKSNRSGGRGTLYRTYDSNATLELEAPARYGRYQFVNWAGPDDKVVSTNPVVSTDMRIDRRLKANYRYSGPVLSLQDSVVVDGNAQAVAVKVENGGSDEMEWSAVSNDPWVRIVSGESGVDNGYLTLEIERNPSEQFRRGSITVTAPETAEYARVLKIVQSNETGSSVGSSPAGRLPEITRQAGTDSYTVRLDETARDIRVEVYAVNAQRVFRKDYYGTAAFGFDLSHCGKGVYLVKIKYDGDSYVQKIVK